MGREPNYVADFDSATGMLRALSRCIGGQDFPLLGTLPKWSGVPMRGLGAAINAMPQWLQEQVYIWSGWFEAVSVDKLRTIDAEQVAEWMVSLYPVRKYPAVAIGSANGAATHLWAAMGIPWLPQTFLVPVARSGIHPDEPQQDLPLFRLIRRCRQDGGAVPRGVAPRELGERKVVVRSFERR